MVGGCPLGDPISPTVSQDTGKQSLFIVMRSLGWAALAPGGSVRLCQALSTVRNFESWPAHTVQNGLQLVFLAGLGDGLVFSPVSPAFCFSRKSSFHCLGRKAGLEDCWSWCTKKEGGGTRGGRHWGSEIEWGGGAGDGEVDRKAT